MCKAKQARQTFSGRILCPLHPSSSTAMKIYHADRIKDLHAHHQLQDRYLCSFECRITAGPISISTCSVHMMHEHVCFENPARDFRRCIPLASMRTIGANKSSFFSLKSEAQGIEIQVESDRSALLCRTGSRGLHTLEFLQFKFCTKFLYTRCSVVLRLCAGIR